MNTTTTETRVPSPEQEIVREASTANLPATHEVATDPATGDPIAKHGHFMTKDFGQVVGAVAAVMAEITPVGKGGENTFHNYKYARMQDILVVLTPLMGKHGIVVFQYESGRHMFDDGKVMAITYDFIVAHKSGQTWISPVPQTGMSPCRTSKNTFDDKAYAKCHTSARKYFLLSLFQVPTEDENDPDNQKREQANAPVPGPTGYVPPHYIEPVRGETPKSWAAKYRAAIKHAKTSAELTDWDNINDALLSSLQEKAPELYAEVMKDVAAIDKALGAAPEPTTKAQPAKADPISTGRPQQTKPVRPEGCPDADKNPDAFVEWANKRLREVAERKNPTELTLIWENEITPASDGLFKPDCDALKQVYDELLARIGG